MSFRDRAYQSGTATSGTAITLDGAAVATFLPFYKAFQIPTVAQSAGTITWRNVPVYVERGDASWGIHNATLVRNGSDVISLTLDTLISSSVYNASTAGFDSYGLAASNVVKVAVVPTNAMLGCIAVAPRVAWSGYGGNSYDAEYSSGSTDVTNAAKIAGAGLLAIGRGARVGSKSNTTNSDGCVAIGDGAAVGSDFVTGHAAYAVGYKAITKAPFSMALGGATSSCYNAGDITFGVNRQNLNQGGTFPAMVYPQKAIGLSRVAATTNATQTAMYLTDPRDSVQVASTDSPLVSGSAALYCDAGISDFEATLTATDVATGDMKRWRLKWSVKTSLSYSTTALFGSLDKGTPQEDAGASAWDVTVTVNSPSNSCSIEVVGEAATEIVWTLSGTIHYSGVYV